MGKIGINLESVKIKNRQAILKMLNNNGAMSRKDIAQSINLTSAAVTQLTTELIEEGIIVEKGEMSEAGRVGRKKILVDMDYNCRSICSITIEKYTSWITLANIKGKVIDSISITTNIHVDPETFLLEVTTEAKKLFDKNDIDLSNMLGIGVSLRGVVNKESGVSYSAYGIWEEVVEVKKIIQSQIKTNVIVENNMKAFAQGEIIYGLGKQFQRLLFLKWYPGVGSAIVIDGEVYNKDSNKVPEIGHCIVESNGERCKCGRRGCLETIASMTSIINSITRIYSKSATPILYRETQGDASRIHDVLLKNIVNNELEMDTYVLEIILKAAEQIARTIVNTITMLATDKVVIYGEIFQNDIIKNAFVSYCKKYDASYDEEYLLQSELCGKFFYIGGIALVVNELFFNVGGNTVEIM
ncbi:MAG: ROK family transcriptional regulator [Eubacteriales bacterium]